MLFAVTNIAFTLCVRAALGYQWENAWHRILIGLRPTNEYAPTDNIVSNDYGYAQRRRRQRRQERAQLHYTLTHAAFHHIFYSSHLIFFFALKICCARACKPHTKTTFKHVNILNGIKAFRRVSEIISVPREIKTEKINITYAYRWKRTVRWMVGWCCCCQENKLIKNAFHWRVWKCPGADCRAYSIRPTFHDNLMSDATHFRMYAMQMRCGCSSLLLATLKSSSRIILWHLAANECISCCLHNFWLTTHMHDCVWFVRRLLFIPVQSFEWKTVLVARRMYAKLSDFQYVNRV